MHIAIVSSASTDSVGGLSAYIRELEKNIRVRDIEVSTLARFVSPDPPNFTDYAAVEVPGASSGKAFPTAVVRPNPGDLWCLKELHHFVNRPLLRHVAKRAYVKAFRSGLDAALPRNVDHIHYVGTGQELLGFAVTDAADRRGVRMSVWPAVHPGQWGDSQLDIELYNKADAVFCQSHFERNHLASKGVFAGKLVTTGLGPATDPIGNGSQFRNQHNLQNAKIILFIGRKDHGKGYHALCSAMSAVCEMIPDVYLVALGPSREPPYPPVPPSAFLDLGMASESDKADALSACDIFCMPSVSDAFGIVYVEAWANRKAVIGGMAPAVRELITEGVNGLCVSQNPSDIAAALIQLLNDEPLRERMGIQGFNLQQSTYNWQAVTDTHLDVFERIIRGHGQ